MNNRKQIFTIANAHLDTSWLWTLERSIDVYIPDTLDRNFRFFEDYPEYKFNFEGSLRYELIKEYYPEKYEKLKEYISTGRWHPCGSCYENGDVNIPSPEALIRNILYGNSYFSEEFGIKSNDIFLPDCFGFGKALPTVAAHCGLSGFSTGKLFWGSSVPIPFDTGKWKGVDGKEIWAALMPFSYTTSFKNVRKSSRLLNKIEDNIKKGLPSFTFAYHGIGDRGGAPHKKSVKTVCESQRTNSSSDIDIFSATTKEYFNMLDALPEDIKSSMPVTENEFLLTAHGSGSYTSRTVTKRFNKRCELLADAAERFSSAAYSMGLAEYPEYTLDNAWKQVIAHHFHDDITGTSFEECYKRNHNDYIQALNTFSAEYTASCKAIAKEMDTSFCKGIPIIVSNPLQASTNRVQAVSVTIDGKADNYCVFDRNGKKVISQTKKVSDNKAVITFIAEAPSNGLSVYDLQMCSEINKANTGLAVSEEFIENNFIKVLIDSNGDISSIFDKSLKKELLNAPIRLSCLNNFNSKAWPAWEIKYEDCIEKPYMYPASPKIHIIDNGPALCSIEITRTAGKSSFRQLISLDCNSRFVSVYNETDWREEATLLKAEFNLSAENPDGLYDIGLGCVNRKTNTPQLYEVPAQKWAGITDKSNDFGVCIFSDSRAGWDKPSDNTLRLTLVHTPQSNYRWECSQHIMDMGINRYSYAIMGYDGNTDDISEYADAFCQPMHTFITEAHPGSVKEDFSFARINDNSVRISAIKKAHNSDRIIIRAINTSDNDKEAVEISFFNPIKDAYEVYGDETALQSFEPSDGKLKFDIGHNSIKSFSVSFEKCERASAISKSINLDFNAVGITTDSNRGSSELKDTVSVPAELVPEGLLYGGINYSFSKDIKNCVVCEGGIISTKNCHGDIHLLITSLNKDKTIKFRIKDKDFTATIPDCFEPIGHWDLMQQQKTAYIKPGKQAITFTHTHNSEGNITAKQFCLFHIVLPDVTADEIILPDDEDIVIFSASAENKAYSFINGDEHFDSIEKREFDYSFSEYAQRFMNRGRAEIILDKFLDRLFTINFLVGEFYNKYELSELYYIIRRLVSNSSYKKRTDELKNSRKQQL